MIQFQVFPSTLTDDPTPIIGAKIISGSRGVGHCPLVEQNIRSMDSFGRITVVSIGIFHAVHEFQLIFC